MITLLKAESTARYQEHFNNLAYVVLGVAAVSEQDKEFIDALTEKYRAVRDQIFVFALKDKFGPQAWNRYDI